MLVGSFLGEFAWEGEAVRACDVDAGAGDADTGPTPAVEEDAPTCINEEII